MTPEEIVRRMVYDPDGGRPYRPKPRLIGPQGYAAIGIAAVMTALVVAAVLWSTR